MFAVDLADRRGVAQDQSIGTRSSLGCGVGWSGSSPTTTPPICRCCWASRACSESPSTPPACALDIWDGPLPPARGLVVRGRPRARRTSAPPWRPCGRSKALVPPPGWSGDFGSFEDLERVRAYRDAARSGAPGHGALVAGHDGVRRVVGDDGARDRAAEVPMRYCTGGHAGLSWGADVRSARRWPAARACGSPTRPRTMARTTATRHIGSASRLYDTYFGYEPAGEVSADGIVLRSTTPSPRARGSCSTTTTRPRASVASGICVPSTS